MKNDVVVCTDFQIEIDKNKVLTMMDCYPDSPVYEETAEEYEEVKQAIEKILDPKCVIAYDTVQKQFEIPYVLPEGKKVFYTIVTIGKEASKLSESYFTEGDCLKGMLADTIADYCVFAMEEQLQPIIRRECKQRKIGILHRYEAPNNIPMEYQKVAFEATHAAEHLNMGITVGYMLDPLKSNCQVYVITQDETKFKVEHDCRHCDNIHCKMRYIPPVELDIYDDKRVFQCRVQCEPEESIWKAIIKAGIHMHTPCGGNGTCGKCKIQLLEGNLESTESDRLYFTLEELEQGHRLACQAYPEEDCKLIVPTYSDQAFAVLGAEGIEQKKSKELQVKEEKERTTQEISQENSQYGFAIDIGTTTIAISLVNISDSKILDTYTGINHQSSMGADVISRIQQANSGNGKQLQKSIQTDLLLGMDTLLKRNSLVETVIHSMVIGANTTMNHLLLGYSCESLGVAPFTPVNINLLETTVLTVLGVDRFKNAAIVLLPGISTFVGGDIVSGLYAKKLEGQGGNCTILVDLGTNGEMALVKEGEILVTSTAMGPACEGGNITWGMGSVQGAISQVDLEVSSGNMDKDGQYSVKIQTIGNKPPIGLCGTGVLETVAELLANDLIEESGLLVEDYFEAGFPIATTQQGQTIVFTQKDIREIQLAKSAIRAGIETLIQKANVSYEGVQKVYLAGGFGFKINVQKAVRIGLFPEELSKKIEPVGNTSLQGAIQYLLKSNQQEDEKLKLSDIQKRAKEVDLSTDKIFNELYVTHMFFE